jgi:Flp pilus assembly protein TadB
MLSTFFAQVAYLLVIALAIVVGVSPLIAFIMIGAVLLCAALVQFRIAGEQEQAQAPAVSV